MSDIIASKHTTVKHADMARGKASLVNVTRVKRYAHNKYSSTFNALQNQIDENKRKYAGKDHKTFRHVGLVIDESVQDESNEGANDGIKKE